MKLKSKELIGVDKEIFELNKFYSLVTHTINSIPNKYALKEFEKRANKIIKKIKEIKTKDEFENIFIENSLLNIKSQQADLNYFITGKVKIDELISCMFGENCVELIKEEIKSIDYEKSWEFYLSYKEYVSKFIKSDEEGLREIMREKLKLLKEDLLEEGKKNYGLDSDYDFELILGQPYSNSSSFHPTNKKMEISVNRFSFYKEDEIKLNIVPVVSTLFHELIGHGIHDSNSKDLPLSLQDNSVNLYLKGLHIHCEGVSQKAEKESIDFCKRKKEKYDILDDYIRQEVLSENQKSISTIYTYYDYLNLKKIEDDKINPEKEMNSLLDNPGMILILKNRKTNPLNFFHDAVYPIGKIKMRQILKKIENKIGKEKMNQNKAKINKALSTGLFHEQVIEKFVFYYLRKEKIIN